jgi:hypothetical protein
VKILCDVNQAECLRHGVDAPSSTVKIEVDPQKLTEEQRNFVADHLYDGLRFPDPKEVGGICPPTYEGFIATVNYGLKWATRPEPKRGLFEVPSMFSPPPQNADEIEQFDKELKGYRDNLISDAIKSATIGKAIDSLRRKG